jgi:hypothetical protein
MTAHPASPSRRQLLDVVAATALLAAAVLGVRGVVVELMWLLTHQRELPWSGLLAPALVVVGWGALANAGAQLLGRTSWRARGVAALVVLLAAGALVAERWQRFARPGGIFTWGYVGDREIGRFPFEGGSVQDVDVRGRRTQAHILPSGLRACGEPAPEGARRVALLGDSFVWGKGVDDAGTLCVAVKERLAGAAPGRFEVLNVGQPGANLGSYVDTLRFAVEAHHADVVTVGLLFPDDAQVVDVNGRAAMSRSPAYRLLASFLDPEVTSDALPVVLGDHASDLAVQAVLLEGLDRLAAEAHRLGVPVVVYLYGGQVLSLDVFERRLEALAATTPELRTLGAFRPPADVARGIEGDGHPTAEGNRWYAEQLVPAVLAAVEPR